MAVAGRPGRRGPNDPGRRARIADAAIRVVADKGLPGLTHRAVAAVAEVPVGSTTYHFTTLEDLLEAALQEASRRNVEQLRDWVIGLPGDADFAAEWADLVAGQLDASRRATIAEYDLYVAALHHPHLRSASADWDDALVDIFASRTDPLTGRMLAALFCGLVLQGSLADPAPSREQVEALARRAIGGPVAAG
ncbi:TetR/AcrR family transcriptional regulator [Pseudonocardia sp. HH130630-07]|uniref:TetR/AcrR family transcriptional regulator n=1 Tax=Pseudonocardia sp. HH130630-07 TaxID=1690815 RepID=UPI0008153A5B|nr:TetR family transcriptional regulator [Pseudonocardia sp. HH130630-07]ANY05253.1 TetR family transcriptional regulator [Pseudonocardia sp. HH130630-07]